MKTWEKNMRHKNLTCKNSNNTLTIWELQRKGCQNENNSTILSFC